MARTPRKNNIGDLPSSGTVSLRRKVDRRAVDEAAITRRAYEIYESRGASHGADLDDWLQAERELRLANPKAS